MKTYVGNKKGAFEAEKDAFSALKSNIDVPIVRYLGSFTHDYGEGIDSDDHHLRKTYNLLLEYGELDLYQYWENLFEIAGAIRKVHYLDVSQGKSSPLRYHG
jgi:metal-dependent HD superfamily phosphatase/phosphodiesterase